VSPFFLALLVFIVIHAANQAYAKNAYHDISVSFRDNLLTISAKNVDLKNVLVKVAEKTNIFVSFPKSLDRKITAELTETTLSDAFERLLNGLNHAIIYSGSRKQQAAIREVFVFTSSKRSRLVTGSARRITSRIKTYESRIESLKRTLSKIDENSRRGKTYSRRIRILEKNIEKLEGKLN
jgi:hypothetical protein